MGKFFLMNTYVKETKKPNLNAYNMSNNLDRLNFIQNGTNALMEVGSLRPMMCKKV